jgi:hypothetical protein
MKTISQLKLSVHDRKWSAPLCCCVLLRCVVIKATPHKQASIQNSSRRADESRSTRRVFYILRTEVQLVLLRTRKLIPVCYGNSCFLNKFVHSVRPHFPLARLLRFEVFTAVATKKGVFWDIKPQFVPHRRHITSPLQSSTS